MAYTPEEEPRNSPYEEELEELAEMLLQLPPDAADPQITLVPASTRRPYKVDTARPKGATRRGLTASIWPCPLGKRSVL